VYKIGRSGGNPIFRLRNLQIGNHEQLEIVHSLVTPDMCRDESKLHAKLHIYRIRGEWFEVPDAAVLLKAI
jgi:hypothetical protein